MKCPRANSSNHCLTELFSIYQNKHWTIGPCDFLSNVCFKKTGTKFSIVLLLRFVTVFSKQSLASICPIQLNSVQFSSIQLSSNPFFTIQLIVRLGPLCFDYYFFRIWLFDGSTMQWCIVAVKLNEQIPSLKTFPIFVVICHFMQNTDHSLSIYVYLA